MPEGHTIHRLAGLLQRDFAMQELQVSSPQGRFAAGAALLDGRRLERAEAYGKHLVGEFEGGARLHVHLGLIGKLTVQSYDGVPPMPVGAVRLRLLAERHLADLRGPQACAVLTPDELGTVLAPLGPDPLRVDADPEVGWSRISASRHSVAELLLDQRVIAGLGNIYRCEILHRLRLHPWREGRQLRRTSWEAVWREATTLLPVGVVTGRIITDDADLAEAQVSIAATGTAEVGSPTYSVYQRAGEPCPRCGATVRTRDVAGRRMYWCGGCQRRG